MLKRMEFTCVLPVFLETFLKTDFHQKLISKWKIIYLKFHTALRIHNKMTFQLKNTWNNKSPYVLKNFAINFYFNYNNSVFSR
jgi:hypothetical protein